MRKFETKKVNDKLMLNEKTDGYFVLINDSDALGFKSKEDLEDYLEYNIESVDTFAELPTNREKGTVISVKKATGIPLINKKSEGMYIFVGDKWEVFTPSKQQIF